MDQRHETEEKRQPDADFAERGEENEYERKDRIPRSRCVEPAGERQDRGQGEEGGQEHHSAVDPGDDFDLERVDGKEQCDDGGDGETWNSEPLLEHPNRQPDENCVERMEKDVGKVKEPRAALDAGVEQAK